MQSLKCTVLCAFQQWSDQKIQWWRRHWETLASTLDSVCQSTYKAFRLHMVMNLKFWYTRMVCFQCCHFSRTTQMHSSRAWQISAEWTYQRVSIDLRYNIFSFFHLLFYIMQFAVCCPLHFVMINNGHTVAAESVYEYNAMQCYKIFIRNLMRS